MFLEVHVLQNFALSNLNRDDAGAPKSCDFGGTRRARISSQCMKRAVRTYFRTSEAVPASQLGFRTKRLQQELVNRLLARGTEAEQAKALATAVVEQIGLKLKNDRTEYLLMLGAQEIDRLSAMALDHQETLLSTKKGDKGLSGVFLGALDGGEAVDLALFGRMIADKPDKNVDAAVQMAHSISTHAVATEFDFYSAVDDLQPEDAEEGAGAGMLGTTLYNSSCYYRYANLDLKQLTSNLGGDRAQAVQAARAFIQGMIHAVPSGKQTGSGAQNPPSLVFITVREKGLWSLVNAFLRPVTPRKEKDLVEASAEAMLTHWQQLVEMYGADEITYAGSATYLKLDLPNSITAEGSVKALVDGAVGALSAAQN